MKCHHFKSQNLHAQSISAAMDSCSLCSKETLQSFDPRTRFMTLASDRRIATPQMYRCIFVVAAFAAATLPGVSAHRRPPTAEFARLLRSFQSSASLPLHLRNLPARESYTSGLQSGSQNANVQELSEDCVSILMLDLQHTCPAALREQANTQARTVSGKQLVNAN